VTGQFSMETPEEQPPDPHAAGICKRPGCGNPLPTANRGRGRSRQFCCNECARRYHNDARIPAPRANPPDIADPFAALETLVRQLAVVVRAAGEQAASADVAQVRARMAEAEAARLRAEASAVAAAGHAAAAAKQIEALNQALADAHAQIRATRAELERRDRASPRRPP
jgi:crotonobetainyl-CoA:carnitine CoA-transferase CaiB-like acyl-CoA transferase